MKKRNLILGLILVFIFILSTPVQAAGKRHVYEAKNKLVVTKGDKIEKDFKVKKNKIYLNGKLIKTFPLKSKIKLIGLSKQNTLFVSVHLKKAKYYYKAVPKKGKWQFKKIKLEPFSSFSYDTDNFVTYDGAW